MDSFFELCKRISDIQDSLSLKSSSFNLIQAVVRGKLHETSHSRILVELLRYDHAILRSFLNEFVEVGLFKDNDLPKILIEKNNIDICILGTNYAVIIENKVNNATEQKEQIDRYVKQIRSECDGKIYVVYLTREYPISPSEYSFDKSKGKCTITTKTYKDDVRKWINERLLTMDNSFSIHSALHHYKKYLDYMFDSQNYTEIPDKIRNQIETHLKLNGYEEDEISALEYLCNELNNTAEICRKLKNEKKWTRIQSKINHKLENLNLPHLVSLRKEIRWDHPDAGIEFSITNYNKRFFAIVSYLNQRYIGVVDSSQSGQLDNKLVDDLKSILKEMYEAAQITDAKIGSTHRYPYWINVDNDENLEAQFIQLINILNKNEDITITNKTK